MRVTLIVSGTSSQGRLRSVRRRLAVEQVPRKGEDVVFNYKSFSVTKVAWSDVLDEATVTVSAEGQQNGFFDNLLAAHPSWERNETTFPS